MALISGLLSCLPLAGAVLAMAATPAVAAAEETAVEKAVFAGGCFWCMEAEFAQTAGVVKVVSGYTGGDAATATYEQVGTGRTGHVEAVEVTFDPARVGYDRLLDIFWSNIDPTDAGGQFCDRGSQYAAGIFYATGAQQQAAEKSLKQAEEKLGRKVAAFLRPAMPFYAAEDDHQEFYKKNPVRYQSYKSGCGRAETLEDVWGEQKE